MYRKPFTCISIYIYIMDLNEVYKKYPRQLIEFAQALDDVFNDVNNELNNSNYYDCNGSDETDNEK